MSSGHLLQNEVITVDGPSASGKGTLAKKLAKQFKLKFLDTGCLYRATAWLAGQQGNAADEDVAEAAARELAKPGVFDFRHKGDNQFGVWIQGQEVTKDIRSLEVGANASVVAAMPPVRAALLDLQKNFVAQWQPVYGVVLDGRDTGARIAPQAKLKIFLQGDVGIRAKWRQMEAAVAGKDAPLEQIKAELAARDKRDAPNTLQTDDAKVINVTSQTPDQVEAAALKLIAAIFKVKTA